MRDKIREVLFFTHACRDFWWRAISQNERRERILEAFDSHCGYFGVSVFAHCQSYVIGVLKMFDGDKRSITLKTLLKRVAMSPHPDGKPIREIQLELKAAEVIAKRLEGIRHKYMAHLSREILGRDFYKEAGLTHNEVNELWDRSWAIFEALSYHVDRGIESPLLDNVQVFDDLSDALVKAADDACGDST